MPRFLTNFFLSAFFVIPAISGLCHGSLIKGNVTDSVSGIFLPGASAVLNNQEVAFADELGNFIFDGLTRGEYIVRVSHVGYTSQDIRVLVRENETVKINVQLHPSALALDEITVNSSFSPEASINNASKIDIGLRPVKSSQDILRVIPGVITAQHAGGGKAEQIFLRGFDIDHGTDIALSVDGIPVNMVSHAHGQGYADLHFLIPEIIDHVNFNKGPYYASVGDFNTAGYADFRTLNSVDKNSVKMEAGKFDM